jgi:two-component system, NtrC family, sensor histidine kinase PilS
VAEGNVIPDNFKVKARLLMVEAGRVAFLVAVLLITFYFQLRQPDFLGHELLVPLYSCVFLSFVVHTIYIWNFDRFSRLNIPTIFLFVFEAFFISALIYFTGITQSIFIFLYLVNIIFCGFIYRRQGSLFLALLTSSLYSTLLIFKPDISGEIVFFSLALNNLGFFSVAMLSGYLSEQLGVMGLELVASHRNIQELKDLNKLIIDNVTSGLVTLDGSGRIVLANKAAETILEESHNLNGRSIFHVLPGLQKFESRFSEEAGRIDRFEIDYFNSRDEKLLLGFSVSPLIHQGQFAGNVLIFQDLTKIKRLERAMQMSEKMAAVGQLAAGIAHEIRNPLAGISGSIQLLRTTTHGEGSEEYRLMSIALKEIDRLNRLITDFLDFVRPSQPAGDTIELKSLITEVVDLVKVNKMFEKKDKKIDFDLSFGTNRSILGHRDQLKQVFYNLLINATHAVDDVTNPKISVSTKLLNGNLVIGVRDNGCGMNTQTQKRIFEPFFTTKAKGTGLGLATVHKIVENHEARIFVESELNKGTEFVIEFPLLDTTENKKRA